MKTFRMTFQNGNPLLLLMHVDAYSEGDISLVFALQQKAADFSVGLQKKKNIQSYGIGNVLIVSDAGNFSVVKEFLIESSFISISEREILASFEREISSILENRQKLTHKNPVSQVEMMLKTIIIKKCLHKILPFYLNFIPRGELTQPLLKLKQKRLTSTVVM